MKVLTGLAVFFLAAGAWAQGALRDYSIDIFYCQHSSADVTNARRARANDALERVKKSNAPVTARVRFLPTGVQSRPGYQVSKDEVRFVERGKDKAAAAELARIVGVPAVAVPPVEERTLYLSAFYCAG
ncbi:MAG: hypothetical protein ACREUE_20110 [Panacagrimonas sp.]